MATVGVDVLDYLADGDAGIRAMGDCEYIEMFFDWVDDDFQPAWRDNSAYTPQEIEAIEQVLTAMLEAVAETRDLDTESTVASGWPRRIAPIAKAALDLMLDRGRFDEEREEAEPAT